MNIEEAIKTFNKLHKNAIVKKYLEASTIVYDEIFKNVEKQHTKYYKSSNKYDYYIIEPYEKLEYTSNGVEYRKRGYDYKGKKKGSESYSLMGCVSLCNYSKEKIIEWIEKKIVEDNLEGKSE